jgi:hypothetical protein
MKEIVTVGRFGLKDRFMACESAENADKGRIETADLGYLEVVRARCPDRRLGSLHGCQS